MMYMFEDAVAFDETNREKLMNWNISSPLVVQHFYGSIRVLGIYCNMLQTWSESNAYQEYTCAICMSEITDKANWRAFKCYSTVKQRIPHCFHMDCIKSWINNHNTCPCCRGESIIK
jgi:hypothetical protein